MALEKVNIIPIINIAKRINFTVLNESLVFDKNNVQNANIKINPYLWLPVMFFIFILGSVFENKVITESNEYNTEIKTTEILKILIKSLLNFINEKIKIFIKMRNENKEFIFKLELILKSTEIK